MSSRKNAINKVHIAQKRYVEAFEELQKATFELSEIVAQEQDHQWQQITEMASGKSRRPKGEIQELVKAIFSDKVPGPLSFQEIYLALKGKTLQQTSESTVRQTLYRMRSQQLLECYSGRWSAGQALIRKNR